MTLRPEPGFHHVVVIPTRNRPDSLLTTLHSVVRHVRKYGRKNVQVILVNDSDPERRSAYAPADAFAKASGISVSHVAAEGAARAMAAEGLGDLARKRWDVDYGRPRNLGLFLALDAARKRSWDPGRVLITFLDDDVRMSRAGVDALRRPVYSALERDYFANLERVFSDPDVGLSGHGYSFDGFANVIDAVHLGVGFVKDALLHLSKNPDVKDDFRRRIFALLPTALSDARNGRFRLFNLPTKHETVDSFDQNPSYAVCGGNMTVRASAAMELPPFISGPARTEDILYELEARTSAWKVAYHGLYLAHVSQKSGGRFAESQVNEHVGAFVRLARGFSKPARVQSWLEESGRKVRKIQAWVRNSRVAVEALEGKLPAGVRKEIVAELDAIAPQLEEIGRGLQKDHPAYAVVKPMASIYKRHTTLWQHHWFDTLPTSYYPRQLFRETV